MHTLSKSGYPCYNSPWRRRLGPLQKLVWFWDKDLTSLSKFDQPLPECVNDNLALHRLYGIHYNSDCPLIQCFKALHMAN